MNCSFEFLSMREETTLVIGCVIYAFYTYAMNNSVREAFQLSGSTFRLFSIQVCERKPLTNSESQV